MSASRSRMLAALLVCLAWGCALERPRPMPFEADAPPFRVHAQDAASAQGVLADAAKALAAARTLPGMRTRESIDVRVTSAQGKAAAGSTRWLGDPRRREGAWIELSLNQDPQEQRFLLGHELAHALFDETWQLLPQIVEEGLADHAGETASPACGAARRLAHAIRLCSWTGPGLELVENGRVVETLRARLEPDSLPEPARMLELDGRSYHDVKPAENRELLYAFGYLIVERIGVVKLRELCVAARAAGRKRLAPKELLEAARLDPSDRRAWIPAIQALVGERELAAYRLRRPAAR
ncbi:MAG: ImmA/IrrE family metallo-endopeptidase [Planctomycetes bacterium]|nr:ImmA/IrrE family metallo-endopeptidase [Planctomycetota bacterium]